MVRLRAPELPAQLPWLNAANPLSLKELRDRIILLDFWTYGCINCLHILPDLKYLEQTYANCLTIIGIHSAKFDHEKEIANIQQALWRYDIRHPVLVDNNFQVWQQYVVRAWPTLILIAPSGYIVDRVSGEGHRERLEHQIQQLLQTDRNIHGTQTHEAIEKPLQASRRHPSWSMNLPVSEQTWERISEPVVESPIAFPGKVIADSATDNLFIADSGHHRIIQTTLKGELKAVIGSGVAGHETGHFDVAQFQSPQGMTFDAAAQVLYVADTGNHRIRQIDLRSQQVETIAGTRRQSQIIYPHGGKALEIDLNSPWDLVKLDRFLFIAMAGSHQIWQLDLSTHQIATFAGTGAEACFDAAITTAAFAQPSGIAANRSQLHPGTQLFIADSEGSSIRVIDLSSLAAVHQIEDRSSNPRMLVTPAVDLSVIRVVDRSTLEVSTLRIPGLCAPTLCFPN